MYIKGKREFSFVDLSIFKDKVETRNSYLDDDIKFFIPLDLLAILIEFIMKNFSNKKEIYPLLYFSFPPITHHALNRLYLTGLPGEYLNTLRQTINFDINIGNFYRSFEYEVYINKKIIVILRNDDGEHKFEIKPEKSEYLSRNISITLYMNGYLHKKLVRAFVRKINELMGLDSNIFHSDYEKGPKYIEMESEYEINDGMLIKNKIDSYVVVPGSSFDKYSRIYGRTIIINERLDSICYKNFLLNCNIYKSF